ncbi:MAG TPA: hypothetical protein VI341_12935 [Actinomycetota bacterium]
MPEGANVEIAHHLHEHGAHGDRGPNGPSRPERWLEIGEAILLAIVAIATAWSGYQSARWDGLSAERYAEASKYRVEQDLAATQAGQQLLFDTSTLNSWLLAKTSGDQEATALFKRRFTDNYAVAFEEWLALDPLHDPDAPPGPMFMPSYSSPLDEKAAELDRKASEAFEAGASSRETGEGFVRVTVIMAMVLFLIAISQRFDVKKARIGLIVVALVFLVFGLSLLGSYPQI